MNTYLTKEELSALSGSTHKRLQIQWLTSEGWPYSVTRTGHPQVSRAYHDARMSGTIKVVMYNEPNYGCFDDRKTQIAGPPIPR
jgi:hypothetical protein